MAKNLIINNLLCFLRTAKNDYADEVLFDLVFSFYSLDEVKCAKELIAGLLNRDVTVRKNPEKKKKDLDDLMELFNDFKDSENFRKDIFVSDSYKRMPPLGLEFISPILTNLSDEIIKINNLLPKITDIKSEITNTADTVRSMKIQISSLEKKIDNNLSSGVNAAASINSRPNLHKPPLISADHQVLSPSMIKIGSPSPDITKTLNNDLMSSAKSSKIVELQRNIYKDIQQRNFIQERNSARDDLPYNDPQKGNSDDDSEWTVVERKRRSYKNKNNVNKENSRTSLITGSKKITENSLKGIAKTVDVFIGRVDVSSTPVEIRKYIESTFNIKVINTEQLSINNNSYNCFKVNVQIQDREKLFDSNMWPEGVIVNKFYVRKPKINKNN